MKCPCHSLKEYDLCCAPFHRGVVPPNALLLMRSRYSAYALGNAAYILATTDPRHPDSALPEAERIKQIERFSKNTRFEGLEILDFQEDKGSAIVTFKAILKQNNRDVSFTEKSQFALMDKNWLYVGPLSLTNS